jgi:hypothetical protein
MNSYVSKLLKSAIALTLLLTAFGCGKNDEQKDNLFHGMWVLDKFEAYDSISNVWIDDPVRIGVNGYILCDGQGHMGVHLTPKGYRDFDASKSIDSMNTDEVKELARFYQSNFVYFADYKTDGSTIEHSRLSATNPKEWGTVLARGFEFNGDTLILTARESIGADDCGYDG